jgi:hypothetical protein
LLAKHIIAHGNPNPNLAEMQNPQPPQTKTAHPPFPAIAKYARFSRENPIILSVGKMMGEGAWEALAVFNFYTLAVGRVYENRRAR